MARAALEIGQLRIIEAVRRDHRDGVGNVVDEHINTLRRRLRDGERSVTEVLAGVGYQLVAA